MPTPSDETPALPLGVVETSARKAKLTESDQARYTRIYGKNWRTIYRWVEKGLAAGEPCPLDDPRAMLTWWPKHHGMRKLPPELEAAAVAFLTGANPEPSPSPAAAVTAPADLPAPKSRPEPSINGVRLEDFDPEEGNRLHELKQLQAAKFDELKRELAGGKDTSVLENRYVKFSETLDKIESRAIDRMKNQGLFVLREEVDRDLAAHAELLRQMRESMERKVLEACPSLSSDQKLEVSAAISRARASEERILCQLDCLESTDDLLRELAS